MPIKVAIKILIARLFFSWYHHFVNPCINMWKVLFQGWIFFLHQHCFKIGSVPEQSYVRYMAGGQTWYLWRRWPHLHVWFQWLGSLWNASLIITRRVHISLFGWYPFSPLTPPSWEASGESGGRYIRTTLHPAFAADSRVHWQSY